MSTELLQPDQPNFLVSTNFLQIAYVSERRQIEQLFIDNLLYTHPSEPVEDIGAVIHETNRIPDSRILIISDGKILRLDGVEVDKSIEKYSHLGSLEYLAYLKIKDWANREDCGAEIWFSAPFPENLPPEKQIYTVSKVDIGEIRYSSDESTKVLLKKAILLDIDSQTLFLIANKFADRIGIKRFSSVDELRSSPVFCTETELQEFFQMISNYTNQISMVEDGSDLTTKISTYVKLRSISKEGYVANKTSKIEIYNYLRMRADQEKMIGNQSESCPVALQTAFQSFSSGSEILGVKTLDCTCPSCDQKVKALIFDSQIHCPNCGAIAPYKC